MTNTKKSITKTVKAANPELYNCLYPKRSKIAINNIKPLDETAKERIEIQSMLKQVIDSKCIEIKNLHTALIFSIATAKVVNAKNNNYNECETAVAINLYLQKILKTYDKCLIAAQLTVYDNDLQLVITYNAVSIRDAIEQKNVCTISEPAFIMLFKRYDPKYYLVSCNYTITECNSKFTVTADPDYSFKQSLTID